MEENPYKSMSKGELWREIAVFVSSTHFSDGDKELFLKLIEEYGLRE